MNEAQGQAAFDARYNYDQKAIYQYGGNPNIEFGEPIYRMMEELFAIAQREVVVHPGQTSDYLLMRYCKNSVSKIWCVCPPNTCTYLSV